MPHEIAVTPEGREGAWLVDDREQLVAWLRTLKGPFHSFAAAGGILLGADCSREAMIEEVRAAERIALLTGEARAQNLGHALSVVTKDERLHLFDIGDVSEVIAAAEVAW